MIPVSEPDLSDLERKYLLDAFDSGWISSRGHYIERAEQGLRAVTHSPYALVCSNGTTALHLALLAAGVGPGDEVVIPSLTYVATLNAVYYVGATPVIVDVDEATWCIDVMAAARAITDRTKAIIAVDLYGHPADYAGLREIADPRSITLIADAAESLGASVDGVPAGSLADVSTFSFFGNKVITSGEGGAITTSDAELNDRIAQLRNQGNHPTERYKHTEVGYNYRMTNLSAAILTAQLERAPQLLERRRAVVDRYKAAIGSVDWATVQGVAPGAIATPWMFSVRLAGASRETRDTVIRLLAERDIESRPVFPLMQDMPFVPATQRTSTPIAEQISREGISLPTFPSLQSTQIDRIVDALRESTREAFAIGGSAHE